MHALSRLQSFLATCIRAQDILTKIFIGNAKTTSSNIPTQIQPKDSQEVVETQEFRVDEISYHEEVNDEGLAASDHSELDAHEYIDDHGVGNDNDRDDRNVDSTDTSVKPELDESNSDPSACPVCHKSFSSVSNRNTHLQSHNKQDTYRCEICQRGFKSSVR